MGDPDYRRYMTCSQKTKNLIMIECKKEYLKHHPEHEEFSLSQGFMLSKIAQYYLEH
jgi:hypothetical protein